MNGPAKSVLITGANGFVGSRLCRKLLEQGLRVIAGVRRGADLSLLEGLEVEFRYGDIMHSDTLPGMVGEVDYIIHNAGVTKVKKPQMFFDVNEGGTRNLFEAVVAHNPGVTRIVYVSSLAGSGPSSGGQPRKEGDLPAPLTAYGKSKLAGEVMALSYSDRFNVVAVRPPGVYGPGDKEIFSFFQTVYRRIRPCIGNQDRRLQLVHVDDLCEGICRAALSSAKSGSVYFVAEQKSYGMGEMIGLLQEACGRKGFPLWIPGPVFVAIGAVSGFLFKLVGATPMLTSEKAHELLGSWEVSTDKARDELGFVSKITFAEGARQTFQWYLKQGWL